ncbi:MAG TPA: YsnF/AvaK domain-containing protein [Anaeromyxobacter sp.]
MAVRSSDGQKLGKVIRCGADEFIVEKGFFFPKDYVARYDEASVSGDEVVLSVPASSLREAGDRDALRAREETAGGMGTHLGTYAGGESGVGDEGRIGAGRLAHGTSEEVRVPVAEEELVAEKRERQAGEVRVHKEVTTEHRQIDVPVTREEVHVERVPVQGGEARGGEARFEKGDVRVPVREEEVEIRKRPVVKEEVRISKTARQEERRAEGDVRREDVRVDREEDVEERGGTGAIDEPEK